MPPFGEDEILGPVFGKRVEDWDEHLTKLKAFWSSVVLMTGRWEGRPMPVHAAITEISDAHFERWLALFAETAGTVCPPAAAAFSSTARSASPSHCASASASIAAMAPSFGR